MNRKVKPTPKPSAPPPAQPEASRRSDRDIAELKKLERLLPTALN